jgi:hypothetical protein
MNSLEWAEQKLNEIRNEYLKTIPQEENDLRRTFLWWRDQAIALQAENATLRAKRGDVMFSGIDRGYLAVHPKLPALLDQLGTDASHVTATKYRLDTVQQIIREIGEIAIRHDAGAQEMIGACAAMMSATLERCMMFREPGKEGIKLLDSTTEQADDCQSGGVSC